MKKANRKPRILAIPEGDNFLKRDIEILREFCKIKTVPGFNYKKPLTVFSCFFGILKGVFWADITFSQFADLHAFFAMACAKILGKKSIVIVGGYEVARVPEINYGYMLKPGVSYMVKLTLNHTDRVLTVVDTLKGDAIKNAGVKGNNIRTIPECYDADTWKSRFPKENFVVTVANKMTQKVIKRKGIDTFIEAARLLPDTKFVIIGPFQDKSAEAYLKSIAPGNVEFTGFVSSGRFLELLGKAKVFCQLSLYEGIPNALCEAMLCECVPVGTENCGIPVAIGDSGFYVPYGDAQAAAAAITRAMASNRGQDARNRIKELFPLEKRRKELKEEINALLGSRADV